MAVGMGVSSPDGRRLLALLGAARSLRAFVFHCGHIIYYYKVWYY